MRYRSVIAKQDIDGVPMHVVAIVRSFPRAVVTVATFHFRAEAERWAEDTIKRKAWRDGSELPDAFDRAQTR